MANQKISTYLTEVLALVNNDRLDVSKEISPGVFDSQYLKYSTLLTELNADLTVSNLYNADGALTGNRIVSLGVNELTFASTIEPNLLKLETTFGRVGIGTATPAETLDVVGSAALNNIAILGTSSTTGAGVDSVGIQGQSTATNGGNHYGVIGKALNGSSINWGGYFEIESGATVVSAFGTTAVEAVNDSTNSNFNYGFHSRVTSTSGTTYGIKATATGAATTNYGAYFSAENAVNNYALITDGGNVGIGTATPSDKLEVVGNAKISAASGTANALWVDTTLASGGIYRHLKLSQTGATRLEVISTSTGTGFRLYDSTAIIGVNLLSLTSGSPSWLALNGNLGIGTAAPTDKLQVVGTVDATRYKVNGVAGANHSGAVATITVVDGLVTLVT